MIDFSKYTIIEINVMINKLAEKHDSLKQNILEKIDIMEKTEKEIDILIEKLNTVEAEYKLFANEYLKRK